MTTTRLGWTTGWMSVAVMLGSTVACDVDRDHELESLVPEPAVLAPLDRLMVESVEDSEGASPHPTSTGSTELSSPARPAAQLPGFDVTIEVVGDDVALEWEDQGPGARYEVFRSEHPFFAPGGTKSTLLTDDAGGLTWIDAGRGGDGDWFYQVRAYLPAGYFEGSTTVGKTVTTLHKGYTKLGQCLLSDVDTSLELFETVGPTAISSHMWDEEAQTWVWSWNGVPGPGLTFSTGDVVSLRLGEGHPDRYVSTGYVPILEDVTMALLPGDNMVTVLPARFGTVMASELLAAVPHATRIGLWDAAHQYTAWYPDGADFEVGSCRDVHVEVSAPSQWPPPLPACPCVDTMPVFDERVNGAPAEPVDVCFDEESDDGAFAPGADGIVVVDRIGDTAQPRTKITVGTLDGDYVDEWGLDPSLVGAPSCVTYDNRQGQATVEYQRVSTDEAMACENVLRGVVADEGGYCAGA